jgi:hypothetical protein
VLSLEWTFDVWSSTRLAGFRMADAESDDPTFDRQEPSYALLLAAREDQTFEGENLDMYGGRNANGYFDRLSNDVAAVTASWALAMALRGYERQIASLRQGFLTLEKKPIRQGVKEGQEREALFLQASGDLRPLIADIGRESDSIKRSIQFYSGIDFELISHNRVANESWVTTFVEGIEWRAERLGDRLSSLEPLYQAVVTSFNTRATLRLQRQVAILTWLLVIVSAISLLFAGIAVKDDLRTAWHHIWP